MKICIMGQGYIGLPTAALFSKNHCEVVGVDINEEMVNNLNKGTKQWIWIDENVRMKIENFYPDITEWLNVLDF